MKFHIYQLAILLISGVMIYKGIGNFVKGKKNQTFLKLFTRMFVWGGIALIAAFPNFSNVLAKIIGIEGNVNAVILVGFIFVFLLIFKLLSAIERLEQDLSTVIRNDSLKNIKE